MYVLVLRNREPVSYGEESVGIKTMIKRISILLPERGDIVQVPIILGNGIRGVLRDIMTYVFLEKVAEKAESKNKSVNVDARALLLMLTGGVLRRRGDEQVTARSIDNLRKRIEVLLPLSIMGFALSNVMIPSKIKISVFYPVCSETYQLIQDLIDKVKDKIEVNFDSLKQVSVKNLIEEIQMMHKDDVSKLASITLPNLKLTNISESDSIRGRQVQETTEQEEESRASQGQERVRARLQAIFQREYVLPGTVFIGFISEIIPLNDAEKELLALSVKRIEESSGVGGAVARGFGSFSIEYSDLDNLVTSSNESKLDKFIEEKLCDILNALNSNPEDWLMSSQTSNP